MCELLCLAGVPSANIEGGWFLKYTEGGYPDVFSAGVEWSSDVGDF